MAVFADLEVFFVQPFDGFAVASGHDDVEENGASVGFEDEAAVFVRDSGLAVKGSSAYERRGEKKQARQNYLVSLKHGRVIENEAPASFRGGFSVHKRP